jgi:hypothetical protein
MNRNTIIGGIIIVILVAVGIWYFTATDTTYSTVSTDKTSDATKTVPATRSTFKSIFTQSGNHQCTYEQVNPTNRSNSLVFIADGKMRGEFRTTTASGSIANIMIYNNGYLYSWKEGGSAGKKSSIKSVAELPEAIPSDLTSGAVYGTSADNVSWDCHDWLKDSKVFVVPTNINFSATL